MLLGTLTRDDDISRDFNAEKNKQSQRRVEGGSEIFKDKEIFI